MSNKPITRCKFEVVYDLDYMRLVLDDPKLGATPDPEPGAFPRDSYGRVFTPDHFLRYLGTKLAACLESPGLPTNLDTRVEHLYSPVDMDGKRSDFNSQLVLVLKEPYYPVPGHDRNVPTRDSFGALPSTRGRWPIVRYMGEYMLDCLRKAIFEYSRGNYLLIHPSGSHKETHYIDPTARLPAVLLYSSSVEEVYCTRGAAMNSLRIRNDWVLKRDKIDLRNEK